MGRSKKITVGILGVSIVMISYSLYALSSEMPVSIKESEFLERSDKGSLYNMQLEFENPSLLVLAVGKTIFMITVDEENLGSGTLDPFVVPPLGKTTVEGTFLADNEVLDNYEKNGSPSVKLSGITKYDILFTSLDVPFTYQPTQEQAREFIQQQ